MWLLGAEKKTEKVVFREELVKMHHDALESFERRLLLVFKRRNLCKGPGPVGSIDCEGKTIKMHR